MFFYISGGGPYIIYNYPKHIIAGSDSHVELLFDLVQQLIEVGGP